MVAEGLGFGLRQCSDLSFFAFRFRVQSQVFCGNFLAPPSIPPARRQYGPALESDMAELTTRFLGLGEERLRRTIELSNRLATPASKLTSRMANVKPFFPPGRWVEGKTPRVSKGKIGSLQHAKIGEVLFTDTFESFFSRVKQFSRPDLKVAPRAVWGKAECFLLR